MYFGKIKTIFIEEINTNIPIEEIELKHLHLSTDILTECEMIRIVSKDLRISKILKDRYGDRGTIYVK